MFRYVLALTLAGLMALPAVAWGPRAQLSITTTAIGLISKNSGIPLDKLQEHVRKGALVSESRLRALYPAFEDSPVRAIEAEMDLMRRVRGDSIDPYYAFRLGVLAKLVSNLTAPLSQARPTYRNLYYADAEESITGVALRPQDRQLVDPRVYFDDRIAAANINNDVIVKDYESGVGFGGMAKASLANDVSRSANTIADVWYTLLARGGRSGNVSEAQIRSYVLDAMDYYIGRKNLLEIEKAEARYSDLVEPTPDMLVKVGDLYFDNQMFEQAMQQYRQVLSMSPGRRDVVEKIAVYYVARGERAMEEGALEDAEEAFTAALNADPLHPKAEALRLDASAMIEEREKRRMAERDIMDNAERLTQEAEAAALDGDLARAMALYRQSNDLYGNISEEFAETYNLSRRGLRRNDEAIARLQEQVIADSQRLSGLGFRDDYEDLAAAEAEELDVRALRRLLADAYAEEFRKLAADMDAAIRFE